MTDRRKLPADAPQYPPHLVPDKVLAPVINLSVAFLEKDRVGPQRIPFIKIGDRCLYHIPTVLEALQQYQRGGPQGNRGRRRRVAEAADGAA